MRTWKWVPALLAVVLLAATGCGSRSGYHLKGKVTFDGKPVPLGRIFFDAEAGGGVSGVADIVDGEYDTAKSGKGVASGPTLVRILGSRKEGADASGVGLPLFQEYTTRVELPKQDGTKDFEVPASAAKGLPKKLVPLD